MADNEMATTDESGALAHAREANAQLRQVVHQFLTRRVTLTPEEIAQTEHELAALSLGTAWLHARMRDMRSASASVTRRDDEVG